MFGGRPTNIKDYFSEEDIFCLLLGSNLEIEKPISSPFRKDRHPSFVLKYSVQGNLYFVDHGTGDWGNWFDLYKILYGGTYKEAVSYIMGFLKPSRKVHIQSKPKMKRKKSDTKIFVKFSKYTKRSLKYWEDYGISLETLQHFNVKPISCYKIFRRGEMSLPHFIPGYSYEYGDGNRKLLFPKVSKEMKWRSMGVFIEGKEQLSEKGETLIITKSLKDTMVLYELGYHSISPSAEGCLLPEDYMIKLRDSYKKIYLLYDNDDAGIQASERMKEAYPYVDKIFLDKNIAKDISEVALLYGKKFAAEQIEQLINK